MTTRPDTAASATSPSPSPVASRTGDALETMNSDGKRQESGATVAGFSPQLHTRLDGGVS